MQGLMIADRPPDSTISSGMVESNTGVSIGNYKGVMLCNRPFAGVQAAQHQAAGAAKAAFVCGNVPSEVGVLKKADVKAVKRTKKETALTRHRKWLAELQRTKSDLESDRIEEERRKEESKKRFMEREARMRQVATQRHPDSKADIDDDESKADVGADTSAAVTHQLAEEKSTPDKSAAKAKRPMWAMTESAAKEVEQQQEEDDTLELLEFAQNLDFEKYIDDMEIQTMMDQVKSRIQELETMNDEEFEAKEGQFREVKGEAKAISLTAERLAQLQEKYGVVDESEPKDDDTRSVARSVLSEHKNLGAIHSQQSMSKKLEAVAEEKLVEPRIITHSDDDGARLANKQSLQNLPYMNRNPSV